MDVILGFRKSIGFSLPDHNTVVVIYPRTLELSQLRTAAGTALSEKAIFQQTALTVGPYL